MSVPRGRPHKILPSLRQTHATVSMKTGTALSHVVTHSSTAPWHPPSTRRLSCVFAEILRSLMHALLSWQFKKAQTGTSEHELKERACHLTLSALPKRRAGGDAHELRLLARRSRPGVAARGRDLTSDNLRRNPDMFIMAVAAMRRR